MLTGICSIFYRFKILFVKVLTIFVYAVAKFNKRNLGVARLMVGLHYLALLCRSCKCYENFSQNSFTANFFIAKQPHIDDTTPCNQAKYPQDAPQQKLSILLLKPRYSTICRHISSFDKISIKCFKKVVCSPP